MPAVSQAQQSLMGQVLAYKRGTLTNPSAEVKKAAKSISADEAEKFARTRRKGLPKHVGESHNINRFLSTRVGISPEHQRNLREEDYDVIAGEMRHYYSASPEEKKEIRMNIHDIIASRSQDKNLGEAWKKSVKVNPKEKGKYHDWSLEKLEKAHKKLKDSGPHPRNSAEYGREKELEFAIRAKKAHGSKKKWGKVGESVGSLEEKWKKTVKVNPAEKGKHSKKTLSELRSERKHAKERGDTDLVHELDFAIRAKQKGKRHWGKVKEGHMDMDMDMPRGDEEDDLEGRPDEDEDDMDHEERHEPKPEDYDHEGEDEDYDHEGEDEDLDREEDHNDEEDLDAEVPGHEGEVEDEYSKEHPAEHDNELSMENVRSMSFKDFLLNEGKKKGKPSAGLSKKQKSRIAKKARRGGDIGKKGKNFKKVEAKAAKRYGSKEAGERVAAAAMWKNAHR